MKQKKRNLAVSSYRSSLRESVGKHARTEGRATVSAEVIVPNDQDDDDQAQDVGDDLLSGSEGDIQKRTTTPAEAILRGAVVLGNRTQGVYTLVFLHTTFPHIVFAMCAMHGL